jgi:hypothetical protein
MKQRSVSWHGVVLDLHLQLSEFVGFRFGKPKDHGMVMKTSQRLHGGRICLRLRILEHGFQHMNCTKQYNSRGFVDVLDAAFGSIF